MDRLEEVRIAIAENTVPGGSAFGRAAAEVIILTLQAQKPSDAATLRAVLSETTNWLIATKPSMTSVRTVSDIAWSRVDDGAESVISAMAEFIAESEQAIKLIAAHAGDVIAPGNTVLFHSFSGSLINVLRRAGQSTPELTFAFTESRPYRESRRVVTALSDLPVEFVGYSDAAVGVAASRADLAIVGADALFADGSFANKTGTLPLALACRHYGVPLYVVSEVSKLYEGDPADVAMEQRPSEEMHEGWEMAVSGRVHITNQFFEVTPADLVTAYLTDKGRLAPSELAHATIGG
ncbi:hypothetical protein [Microbacterium lacus]|uniref:Translation initiation factor IF-2 n=1 Tax=Microbacterium lacus TaxID=415217 RepID=A0ABN2FXX6_9MICO